MREGDGAELGRGGLAEHHAAGGAQPRHVDRVGLLRRRVLEQQRPVRRRQPARVLEILHPNRYAGERTGIAPGGDGFVHRGGGDARSVLVEHDEGVERVVVFGDAAETLVEDLGGLQLTGTNSFGNLDGSAHPRNNTRERTPESDRLTTACVAGER